MIIYIYIYTYIMIPNVWRVSYTPISSHQRATTARIIETAHMIHEKHPSPIPL